MKNRIQTVLFAVAITTNMGVYAEDKPNTAPAQASTASDEASADAAKRVSYSKKNGYRRVVKNGQELFCRREAVTGTRTRTNDTCLTQAQLDAQIRSAREFIDKVVSTPTEPEAMDAGGGRTMGPMTNT